MENRYGKINLVLVKSIEKQKWNRCCRKRVFFAVGGVPGVDRKLLKLPKMFFFCKGENRG